MSDSTMPQPMTSMLGSLNMLVNRALSELFPFYTGDNSLNRDKTGAAKKAKKKGKKGKKGGKKGKKGGDKAAAEAESPDSPAATPVEAAPAAASSGVPERDTEYKCSVALRLNAMIKKQTDFADAALYKSPLDVANAIAAKLAEYPETEGVVDKVEVVPPGFINFRVATSFLVRELRNIAGTGKVAPPAEVKPVKVVIDFSSPNIAKEMHVGHLRSTIIGESISRILEFCGFDVARTNHVGDWGTQFGMLIAHLKDEHPNFVDNPPNISDLQAFYRAAKARFDAEPDFTQRAYSEVVALQSRSEESLKAWNLICEVSRVEFQRIYDRLQVTTHEKGESFYHDQLADTVELIKERIPLVGTFTSGEDEDAEAIKERRDAFAAEVAAQTSLDNSVLAEDNGALCFWIVNPREPNAPPKPLIVQKADGGYTYATTDFAALKYRLDVEKADWILYVVDSGQASHLECIYKGGQHMGLFSADDKRVEHVGFGVVVGEDGKKFKTRSGDVVRLVDLLDTAVEGAEKLVRSKLDERLAKIDEQLAAGELTEEEAAAAREAESMDDAEIRKASDAIGHGCIKYADLRCNRLNNYMFSFERMLDTRGNTAVYLLYAYARMCSILRVGTERLSSVLDVDAFFAASAATGAADLILTHPSEQRLAFTIARFAEEIEYVLETLLPSRLCELLYDLSTAFSEFYHHCKVVDLDDIEVSKSRLLIVRAALTMMASTFDLLGVEYVGRL
ncbi:arginyl-tRNA synthetase [Thecamonas trahens ATCC 50062]|uniref:arginine--tRNA ligase n=1 Tax=Thecamonas trahens ATCC 50062 TaxID=461836 RepID=A0A0L0DGH8_THETB|nr:arginyl-tRNA synthetase [Thecamonas trahens ATCC 50062]KNC51437.1 arginyl-tRNA synthetase [Thecamonas trahens ATCC 50062]|eukprot:XP_013756100.1 arginyl-tRNA synthetase [Thecamonas trahens ATCC 50062]